MKRQAEARKIQEEKKLKKEAERDMEKERAENYRRQEESRQMELQRLEQLKMKAMMQQQKASSKVELKYYTPRDSRPGEFGFGNVTTGQVSMKKYEILARASSVGRSATEDRENLNPDLVRLSHSARASPSPIALQQQMASLSEVDQGQAMMVQVTLVFGFLAQVRIHFLFFYRRLAANLLEWKQTLQPLLKHLAVAWAEDKCLLSVHNRCHPHRQRWSQCHLLLNRYI